MSDDQADRLQWGFMVLVVLAATIACCVLLSGCVSMYPKWVESPEVQAAAVAAFRDSVKTADAEFELHNPEVEFFYKIGVGARVVGIKAEVDAQASSGPQK